MTLTEKGKNRPDPVAFGEASAQGLGVNLLVSDMAAAVAFADEVLQADVVYWEDHFAVVRALGSQWLLHSDWSYRDHEFRAEGVDIRGAGVELRLYGLDPDACVERARAADAVVVAAAADKPHGLREAHIMDQDGYVWSPSVASKDAE